MICGAVLAKHVGSSTVSFLINIKMNANPVHGNLLPPGVSSEYFIASFANSQAVLFLRIIFNY